MSACHHIKVAGAGRVHIPGCMGAAVYGPSGCTCGASRQDRLASLECRIARLEARIDAARGERGAP